MFKKNNLKILIIFIIIIALAIIIYQFLYQPAIEGQESILINETSVDNLIKSSELSARDQAIEKYLASQKQFAWQTEENSQHLCVFDNLGNEDDLFPLSLWVYCQEYIIEDGELIELSGVSGPVLVDYPNILSYYSLDKFSYQVPRDGSLYGQDIKIIFPLEIQNKILNFQGRAKLFQKFRDRALVATNDGQKLEQ